MTQYSDDMDNKAATERYYAALESNRPFVILRPRIYPDGDQWCVLYGDDLQEGVAGFGATPDAASRDFDRNWSAQWAGRTVVDVVVRLKSPPDPSPAGTPAPLPLFTGDDPDVAAKWSRPRGGQ